MTKSPERDIEIRIEGDGDRAVALVPAEFPPALLTSALVLARAKAVGLLVDAALQARVDEMIQAFTAHPQATVAILLEAVEEIDGEDGRIEWRDGFDPLAASERAGAEAKVDHYTVQNFVRVKTGDPVATQYPASRGEDGRNVCGVVRKAVPGRTCPIKIDRSLDVDAHGQIIAQTDGILMIHEDTLRVSRHLDIRGDVNFSTGHIDFDGCVNIAGNICDRFIVKASECISVGGVVEAATVICGADFTCRCGIAAKERGRLEVVGNAAVGFLNNVRGFVHGNLVVRREIINCDLCVGGDLACEHGALIGGTLWVGGSACLGAVGSGAGVHTTLLLGEMPALSVELEQLNQQARGLRSELTDVRMRHGSMVQAGGRLGEREALRTLDRELARVTRKLEACESRRVEVRAVIKSARRVNVQVTRAIFPRVCVRIGAQQAVFHTAVKGPLRLGWDEQHQLQFRVGEGPIRQITEVAHVLDQAA